MIWIEPDRTPYESTNWTVVYSYHDSILSLWTFDIRARSQAEAIKKGLKLFTPKWRARVYIYAAVRGLTTLHAKMIATRHRMEGKAYDVRDL